MYQTGFLDHLVETESRAAAFGHAQQCLDTLTLRVRAYMTRNSYMYHKVFTKVDQQPLTAALARKVWGIRGLPISNVKEGVQLNTMLILFLFYLSLYV